MLSTEAKKLRDEIGKIRAESERAKDEVVTFARGLVLTLKDRGCAAAAGELESRLFMLDAQTDRLKGLMGPESVGYALEILEDSFRER